MIPVLADLNDAVRTLILSVINIASLLLLAYVLLDLARNFISGLPEIARTFHDALRRLWEPILARSATRSRRSAASTSVR